MIRGLMIRDGTVQMFETDEKSLASINGYDSEIQSREGFRESTVPIQMVLISYSKDSAFPYHMSFFSQRSYSYIEMDRDAYSLVIPHTELHTHNTYELCIIRDGSLYQRIESERHLYPEGSCFLLNRNVRHNEEYESSFCTATLSISEDFLKETLIEEISNSDSTGRYWREKTDLRQFLYAELNSVDSGKKSYIDFIPTGPNTETAELFEDIARAILQPGPGQTFLIKSLLCRILDLLNKKELHSTVPVELGTASEASVFSQIVKVVDDYKGRVSRQDLSDQLHYSGNYLNRIAKKYTGMNLTEYANSVSMRYASSMLLNTDLTIGEIAETLSFTNKRYFYEAFEKIYGTTPRKYRAEHKVR